MYNILLSLSLLCLGFSKNLPASGPIRQRILLEEDLFKRREDIKVSWLGNLKSAKTRKALTNIPMFVYQNKQFVYAKIICVPVNMSGWNAKFKSKSIKEKASISKTLSQQLLNHSFGEKFFTIYAFLQQGNNLNTDKKNNDTATFPATIYIYRNAGSKWNRITQKVVSSSVAYQQLQYDIALASARAI